MIPIYDDMILLPHPASIEHKKATKDSEWRAHPLAWIYGEYHCPFYKDTDKRKKYLKARANKEKANHKAFAIVKHGGFRFGFGNSGQHLEWTDNVSRVKIKL